MNDDVRPLDLGKASAAATAALFGELMPEEGCWLSGVCVTLTQPGDAGRIVYRWELGQ
jgi:hypothetical protein